MTKVFLALCAFAGLGSLALALDDPTRWGMWFTSIGMVFSALAVIQQGRRRHTSDPAEKS